MSTSRRLFAAVVAFALEGGRRLRAAPRAPCGAARWRESACARGPRSSATRNGLATQSSAPQGSADSTPFVVGQGVVDDDSDVAPPIVAPQFAENAVADALQLTSSRAGSDRERLLDRGEQLVAVRHGETVVAVFPQEPGQRARENRVPLGDDDAPRVTQGAHGVRPTRCCRRSTRRPSRRAAAPCRRAAPRW